MNNFDHFRLSLDNFAVVSQICCRCYVFSVVFVLTRGLLGFEGHIFFWQGIDDIHDMESHISPTSYIYIKSPLNPSYLPSRQQKQLRASNSKNNISGITLQFWAFLINFDEFWSFWSFWFLFFLFFLCNGAFFSYI